jgi:predicted  nucleic acid-binding Zn-ribbon protein
MNKTRRKALNALQDRLTALNLDDVLSEVKDIREELETLRGEEQESFDNLPESLQSGERGQDMEAAITSMDSAMEKIESLADAADESVSEEFVSNVEDAKGME